MLEHILSITTVPPFKIFDFSYSSVSLHNSDFYIALLNPLGFQRPLPCSLFPLSFHAHLGGTELETSSSLPAFTVSEGAIQITIVADSSYLAVDSVLHNTELPHMLCPLTQLWHEDCKGNQLNCD